MHRKRCSVRSGTSTGPSHTSRPGRRRQHPAAYGLARAVEPLDLATAEATAMGMTTRGEAWTATRETMSGTIAISRDGRRWLLTYRGRSVLVEDMCLPSSLTIDCRNAAASPPARTSVREMNRVRSSLRRISMLAVLAVGLSVGLVAPSAAGADQLPTGQSSPLLSAPQATSCTPPPGSSAEPWRRFFH
jgi:hypothetical protein